MSRAVLRVCRLLAQQVACSSAPSTAAAVSTGLLHLLHSSSQLAAKLGTQQSGLISTRSFAASAAGGDAGGDGSSSQPPAEAQQPGAAAAVAGTSDEELQFGGDIDAALEAWGKAMDEGDWDTAWAVFEGAYPVDEEEGLFPTLEELQEWDPEAEERAARRQREMEKQAEQAARWTRQVDAKGRSHAAGKRKTSVARVWLRPGAGHIMVNKRPFDAYFPSLIRRNDVIAPFEVTENLGAFDAMVNVHGGGVMGQAQAVRHGIARALQRYDPGLRPVLKSAGLLTRDDRKVERKKVGLRKARRGFQWVKR